MNYTENYQLPLWDADDAIKRTDFNDANSAIDAALGELSNKSNFVKLKEASPTEQVTEYILDLSDIDWSQWHYVLVDVHLRGSGSFVGYPTGYATACSTTGWNTTSGYYTMVGQLNCGESADTRVTIHACQNAGRRIVVTTDGIYGSCNKQLSMLSSLTISAIGSSYLTADSRFVVWGVK